METITQIFDKHKSDKGSHHHNYCRQYEQLLAPYRRVGVKILEIGILDGQSLKIWKEAFQKASVIVGVDINPACMQYGDGENVVVKIGNATDSDFINSVAIEYGPFDVILDDGSHVNKDVIIAFELLWKHLQEDGIYIVEDTICYKSKLHRKRFYPNHIKYFTKYIPYLNQWRFDSAKGIKDNCVDPFKVIKKTKNYFEATIDRIEFGCSYIALFKKTRWHWLS